MEKTPKQLSDAKRYAANRTLFIERNRQWRLANPEKAKEKGQRTWEKLKEDPDRYARYLNAASNRQRRLKVKVLEHYAGGPPRCECCGTDAIEFLTLDHIDGGGYKHRKEVGANVYQWVVRTGYPKDIFRILCLNCNFSVGHYGYCPHIAA